MNDPLFEPLSLSESNSWRFADAEEGSPAADPTVEPTLDWEDSSYSCSTNSSRFLARVIVIVLHFRSADEQQAFQL